MIKNSFRCVIVKLGVSGDNVNGVLLVTHHFHDVLVHQLLDRNSRVLHISYLPWAAAEGGVVPHVHLFG